MTPPATSAATVVTDNARRYMIQLCKHFAHKIPATHSDHEGKIEFEAGIARLRASEGTLLMVVEAQAPEGVARLEQVVESHLRRFSFREPDMAVEWRRAQAA